MIRLAVPYVSKPSGFAMHAASTSPASWDADLHPISRNTPSRYIPVPTNCMCEAAYAVQAAGGAGCLAPVVVGLRLPARLARWRPNRKVRSRHVSCPNPVHSAPYGHASWSCYWLPPLALAWHWSVWDWALVNNIAPCGATDGAAECASSWPRTPWPCEK